MPIADAILTGHEGLNSSQREAIACTEGPLLVIAGPGSGKTFVLVLRALNLLLQGLAKPGEILLCTFTQKAAFELRDRLSQLFFLFDHFKEIIGQEENGLYLGRWKTRWTAIQGARRYFNKIIEELIEPDPDKRFAAYPAVFSIWGENKRDEARRCADLVLFLKENRIIEDESQVAILLHSVRQEHSTPYLDALTERGINAFCPRARAYFENDEIRSMIACFAILLGYYGDGRGEINGQSLNELAGYNVFQTYYHYSVITARNREHLRFHFFHSFVRLLYEGGINEYERP